MTGGTYGHRLLFDTLMESEMKKVVLQTGRIDPQPDGMFMPPTILIDTTPEMKVRREETFGPLKPLVPYETIDEAIQIANSTEYGLSGSVYTRDPAEGRMIARRLKTGSVNVNDALITYAFPSLPFGGMKQSGVGRYHGKMGLRAFPTSELVFDDVFVPEENLIVQPGVGLKTTFRTFELARSMMAAGAVGFGRAALSLAGRYAQEREQSGRKIGSFQLVQEMIADMKARTEASSFLAYRALWMMDQDMRCDPESSLAKAYATEACVKTTRECIQILGAYGLSEEYPAERLYRDASCMTIPDGTTQIQKMIVARSIVGLNAFF